MEVRKLDSIGVLALKYVYPNILGSIFKFLFLVFFIGFKLETRNRKEQYNLDMTD